MSPKELTRLDILRTAGEFRWTKKMPKWRVIVNNRELPARPLVLRAAQVPPNDPTNSHQAVALLESLGFETRYCEGPSNDRTSTIPSELSDSGTLGSVAKLVSEISKQVPTSEWDRLPSDLAENLDHYLYGRDKQK
jgi:hypothetical protein